MGEAGRIPPADDDPISRANAFLKKVGETQYEEWAREDLRVLLEAHRSFISSPSRESVQALQKAFQSLQDMGGTFGYPLISQIGYMAARFLDVEELIHPKEREFLNVLVGSIEMIVSQKMAGEGGASGQALIENILAAKKKVDSLRLDKK